MFAGHPLTTLVTPAAAILGHAALRRRLTVYAGAGLSAAEPTSLPGAAALAEKLVSVLSSVVDLSSTDPWDLIAVADRIALEPAGPALLHDALTRVADFADARPNYAHEVLALLLCEGAITALEANYDDCIERAAQPERIPAVVSDADRLEMDKGALLKVHGCISRPSSMRVTSDELTTTPLFAKTELAARLSADQVAFIGLGSPADYVRSSVEEFIARVPHTSLTLVDPGIGNWDTSEWNKILPDLGTPQRVAMDAEAFCDEILRFYINELWRSLRDTVRSLEVEHLQRDGVESLASAMESRNAVWVMKWLRSAVWKYGVGKPVVGSSRVAQALLALSMLTSGIPVRLVGKALTFATTSDTGVLLVVADHAPNGGLMAVEAERRVADARADGRIPDGSAVVVVCCGHNGRLGANETEVLRGSTLPEVLAAVVPVAIPEYLIGGYEDTHLIDSITAGSVIYIAGDALIDLS